MEEQQRSLAVAEVGGRGPGLLKRAWLTVTEGLLLARTRGTSFHPTTHSCIQSVFPECLRMPGTVLDSEGTVVDGVLSDEGRPQTSRPRNAKDDSGS